MYKPVLALAATGALLAGPPAVAQAPQPTLQFDQPCYTSEQPMGFTGAGYTPGGEVDVYFTHSDVIRSMYPTHADATGAIADVTGFESVADVIRDDERADVFVAADDVTRADAGAPIESQFGGADVTFTDWLGFSPGRYVPGKRVSVEVFGWAFATGQTTWLLFRKGPRTVASAKVGRLDDVCGDRKAKVRVPRKLKPGRYKVVLSTKRRGLSERYTWRTGRVTRRAAAASAASRDARRMSKAG
jgi:hypothetical protein